MADEYLLVKKTIYDRMKEKQSEQEKSQSMDQGVNTEETMSTIKTDPPQSGSGLIYAGSKKRKATSPPGIRSPKKKRTMWLTF